MLGPNAVVSTVIRFAPPLERPVDDLLRAEDGLAVELEDGRRVRLDPSDARSTGFVQVLDGLRRQHLPVYVEFDPDTSAVRGLRVPYVSRVLRVRVVDRGLLDVVLANSHARHFLRESAEDFEVLRARLDEALRKGTPVILVDDDEREIIDVRPVPPGFGESGLPFPERPPRRQSPRRRLDQIRRVLSSVWFWPKWPWQWSWFRCVSSARAQEVVNAMRATSCNPLTVPAPCIPFLFPDDGCWGRAHEMCRLMELQNLRPRKVWVRGDLDVATRNSPTCKVKWSWHVAPTLCVRRWFWREEMVVDPSLFDTPVSKAQWAGVGGDPLAVLTDTDASIFHLFDPAHPTDPTYAETNSVLATYRLALLSRSISDGPPPYAHCP